MNHTDLVIRFIKQKGGAGATNKDIAHATQIKPHQQVFMITSRLRELGLINGNKKGNEWYFYPREKTVNNTDNLINDNRRDELIEFRNALMDEYQKNSEAFDKTIITLASAALAFSVTFLNDIVPNPIIWTYALIFASWISFGLSLVIIVLSYLMAIKTREDTIKQIDKNLSAGKENYNWRISRSATRLSWFSAGALFLGIFFYIIFAISNLLS